MMHQKDTIRYKKWYKMVNVPINVQVNVKLHDKNRWQLVKYMTKIVAGCLRMTKVDKSMILKRCYGDS